MTREENETRLAYLKNIVLNMPQKPGSYQYYDKRREPGQNPDPAHIIYVGKAKHLKNRVSSYFHKEVDRYKTKVLVSKIQDITYTVVNTEEDALLLENSLIKKYNPRYNVLLKDGKTYPSICVTNEFFPHFQNSAHQQANWHIFRSLSPHLVHLQRARSHQQGVQATTMPSASHTRRGINGSIQSVPGISPA